MTTGSAGTKVNGSGVATAVSRTQPLSSNAAGAARANALTSKITSVLSTSYADREIRDALEILDQRRVQDTPQTRRRLKLDVQKEVIDCNGEIIMDFGQVAEVRHI
jgi:hypothetical protein